MWDLAVQEHMHSQRQIEVASIDFSSRFQSLFLRGALERDSFSLKTTGSFRGRIPK